MGLRFHKSFSVLPGVRVNISKSGLSLSIGGAPMTINFRKGGSRMTTSVPGTGISYTTGTSGERSPSSVLGKLWVWLAKLLSP